MNECEENLVDPDDSLAETHTDKDGFFHLQGKENEIRTIRVGRFITFPSSLSQIVTIQPYLRITHNCDVKDRATCTRTTDIEIPQDKIGADKLYDMNFVNLNIRGTSDDEKCT